MADILCLSALFIVLGYLFIVWCIMSGSRINED